MSIPESVQAKFDIFDWRNAAALFAAIHPAEFEELMGVLGEFRLLHSALVEKGKNKTETAKQLDSALYQHGWVEKSFDTKIVVDGVEEPSPTHSVDCFKNRVALEVEWNNKDPFYDRDLNNFRLLYDLRVIDLGVIVTRSTALQQWQLRNSKFLRRDKGTYGSSTTHSEKLLPKIRGGGAGGCPVLVFSMKPEAYVDDRN